MTHSLTRFYRCCTFSQWITLLTVLMVALFMRLGFWQLDRAAEKKSILTTQRQLASLPPMKWQPQRPLPNPYQRIQIHGQIIKDIFLLDNQFHDHQIGYDVLSPVKLDNDQILFIDRGWVQASPDRQQLPQIAPLSGSFTFNGYAYFPSKKRIEIGAWLDKSQGHMKVIEWVDVQALGHILHKSVYPFIIRLENNEPHAFLCDWPIVSFMPSRHYGYAFQWFSLAVLLIILFFTFKFKKIS